MGSVLEVKSCKIVFNCSHTFAVGCII